MFYVLIYIYIKYTHKTTITKIWEEIFIILFLNLIINAAWYLYVYMYICIYEARPQQRVAMDDLASYFVEERSKVR